MFRLQIWQVMLPESEVIMEKQFKVVIIGFAHMHINDVGAHFAEHPRVDLCACADTVPAMPELRDAPYTRGWNLEFAKKKFGIKNVYKDYIEMLEKERPQLAIITSENARHAEIVEECAKRGVGACIEKPMASSLSHAMRMMRASETYNTTLIVNWPSVWNPELHLMKKFSDEGRIGKLIEFKGRSNHTGPLGPGAEHKGVTDKAEPMSGIERANTWWHQADQGGGAMLDYCCYGCMLSYWFFEKPAISAFGMRGNFASQWSNAEDNAAMIVRYPDSYATVEANWTTYNDLIPHGPMLFGTEGAMTTDVKDGVGVVKILEPSGNVVYEKPGHLPEKLRDIASAFVCYMDGEPLNIMLQPEFNLHSMAILDAGLRSADSGKMEIVNNAAWQIG